MEVIKTLEPGRSGTKRLVERYGDQLVAVHYRLDRKTYTSFTKVELIVEQKYALFKHPVATKPNCNVWSNKPAASGMESSGLDDLT